MIRAALLSATLFLSVVGSAQAQKLSLPVGEWGRSSNHGLNCNPPFLKIEPNRIIKRLGGGEGRCPIKKIIKKGSHLMVDVKCSYDKIVHDKYLIQGDDDDSSFSILIKRQTHILFNNTPHEICRNASGDGR